MYYKMKGNRYNSNKLLRRDELKNIEICEIATPPSEPIPNNNGNEEPENGSINMPSENEAEIPNFESNLEVNTDREIELMENLYSEINSFLYPFVIQVLDEYDFIGSPIYSVMGIDRETISQMVDRVLIIAEQNFDQVGEVKNERTGNYLREWDRWGILRSNVESLILTSVFFKRRPEYFRRYAPGTLLSYF